MERMYGEAVMIQFKTLFENILGGKEAGRTTRQILCLMDLRHCNS